MFFLLRILSRIPFVLLLCLGLAGYAYYIGRLPELLYAMLVLMVSISQYTQHMLMEDGTDVNLLFGKWRAAMRLPLSWISFIAIIAGTVWAFYYLPWYEILGMVVVGFSLGRLLVRKKNLLLRAWKKPMYDATAIGLVCGMWYFFWPY